jgi:hypothetical protein
VADPKDETDLVAYHGKSGQLCIGHIGRGLGGGACPEALQRGAENYIYIEGYARQGGADVSWGFAPSRTEELIVIDGAGVESSPQLFDGGQEFNSVRFFLTPLSLTKGEITLRALDAEGRVITERKAGGQAAPPPPPPPS